MAGEGGVLAYKGYIGRVEFDNDVGIFSWRGNQYA